MEEREIIFIKAGGSIFSQSLENPFDVETAKQFINVLKKFTDRYKFIVTLGGGAVMRHYRDYFANQNFSNRDLDWIGISVNNLNAMIMRSIAGAIAEERVVVFDQVVEPEQLKFEKDFLFAGGQKPGQSGDTVAVNTAINSGANKIISIKDVDGIYTADPDKDPNAKLLSEISWNEYSKLFGLDDLKPGGNYPIDPMAADICSKNNLSFVVMGKGDNFDQLENYLAAREFKGTVVQ